MFIFTFVVFFISLLGLCALFSLKLLEEKRGVAYVPEFRARMDRFAKILKAVLRLLAARLQELPHDLGVFLRMLVHFAAVICARGARAAEQAAHQVADRVSHKHRFERGETRSNFLRTVSEHKNVLNGQQEGLEGRR